MSGPKISEYGLTSEQRIILRQQWYYSRRALAAVYATRQTVKELRQKHVLLEDMRAKIDYMLQTGVADADVVAALEQLAASLKPACDELAAKADAIKPQSLSRRRLDDDTLEAYRLEAYQAVTIQNEVRTLQKHVEETLAEARTMYANYQNELVEEMFARTDAAQPAEKPRVCAHALDFSHVRLPELGQAHDTLAEPKAIMHDQLEDLRRDGVLPEALRQKASAMQKKLGDITDTDFLRNFAAISVKPLLNEAAKAKAARETLAAQYRVLYSDYHALCELTGETPQSWALSETALAELREAIARLEGQALQDAERAYIAACVDEVMTEMGYELLGKREVRKRSGRSFKNELYSFDEGAAVSVTYSGDGQIAMELGGLDYVDRTPDVAETERLCAEMESFCKDFAAIEERLAAKGVAVTQRTAMYPAAAEHAAIINLNDYEMTDGKKPAAFSAKSDYHTAKPQARYKDIP